MPKLKFATESNGTTKFYPISITPGIIDTTRNQRLSVTLADLYSKINSLIYENVYIGVASASSTVLSSDYYHSSVLKGSPISFSNTSGKLWLIMPSSYSPVTFMSGIEVPMILDSTTTISGNTYNVWKSSNTYSGGFNISLY